MSSWIYIGLLFSVAAGRLLEMRLSRLNQEKLASKGAAKADEPGFRWMVLFHCGVLAGCALETVLLRRPLLVPLAIVSLIVFLAANAVRWWVIQTMREHWNVQVMASVGLGVVSGGPFRSVRHPNYAAVFVEMLALPLIHTAWITAIGGAAAHALILRARLRVEEPVLDASAEYRALMGAKPRFLPGVL